MREIPPIMNKPELNLVRNIINSKPRTKIEPKNFFIAWSGVPVLTYSGFSKTIADLKEEIEYKILSVEDEKPGSKWPKTSLGALSKGKKLTLEDFKKLHKICDEFTHKIPHSKSIVIENLQLVVSLCRSLENRVITSNISFRDIDPEYDDSPSDDQVEYVRSVIMQFDEGNMQNYYQTAIIPNHDETHYRSDYMGVVLVFDLPMNKTTFIDEFIARCEKKFPGYFKWFEAESRHITIRKLFTFKENHHA